MPVHGQTKGTRILLKNMEAGTGGSGADLRMGARNRTKPSGFEHCLPPAMREGPTHTLPLVMNFGGFIKRAAMADL